MGKRVIKRVAVAATILLPLVGTGVAAEAHDAERPDCVVPDDSDMRRDSDDFLPHEKWIAAPGPQQAVQILGRKLARLFGEPTKEDSGVNLDQGLIGATLNHHTKQYVVVVDPALVDMALLDRRLERTAARAAEERGVPDLDISVIAGCFAAPDLAGAQQQIVGRSRGGIPELAEATYGVHLDPADSRFHVNFRFRDWEAAHALKRQLGGMVKIEFGGPERQAGSRGDDSSPHYGGAGLHTTADGQTQTCTSGFSVHLPGGGRGSVTADHCVEDGVNFGNADDDPYGIADVPGPYPFYDLARIKPEPGHKFTNKIWVDPCCPSVRTVTDAVHPVVNGYVCISGYITRAKCGIKVVTLNASFCAADGCTTALLRGEKLGSAISAIGDSGAPIYSPGPNSTAVIRGLHIGGDPGRIFAEKWNTIANHLGVTIAKTSA